MEINNKMVCVAASVLLLVTSCDHQLLRPLEVDVRLSEENTFEVGKPVTFEFDGYADYVYFYSGEPGHEYANRNRTNVSADDIEYAKMKVKLYVENGKAGGLNVYVTDSFEGLAGDDIQKDGLLVTDLEEAIKDDMTMQGWSLLDLQEPATTKLTSETEHDISAYIDNFLVAVRWKPVASSTADMQRYYQFDFEIETKFKGFEPQVFSGHTSTFGYTLYNVNTIKDHEDDHYYNGEWYNGSIRAQVEFNTSRCPDGFRMLGGRNLGELIHAWIVSTPMSLTTVKPDEGLSIKAYGDDMTSYAHVYDTPGTYTATFILSNGNIQGSASVVKEVVFEVR